MVTFSCNREIYEPTDYTTKQKTTFYKIYISNNSNKTVRYDFKELTDGNFFKAISGSYYGTAYSNDKVAYNFDLDGGPIEIGNVGILTVNDASVRMRFWSSGGTKQLINLLGENNFTVTKDQSDFNEITGHGVRVTLDSGGHDNDTLDIFIQIYNQ